MGIRSLGAALQRQLKTAAQDFLVAKVRGGIGALRSFDNNPSDGQTVDLEDLDGGTWARYRWVPNNIDADDGNETIKLPSREFGRWKKTPFLGGVAGSVTAGAVSYDNSGSGLDADDVQEAIDEVVDDIAAIDLSTALSNNGSGNTSVGVPPSDGNPYIFRDLIPPQSLRAAAPIVAQRRDNASLPFGTENDTDILFGWSDENVGVLSVLGAVGRRMPPGTTDVPQGGVGQREILQAGSWLSTDVHANEFYAIGIGDDGKAYRHFNDNITGNAEVNYELLDENNFSSFLPPIVTLDDSRFLSFYDILSFPLTGFPVINAGNVGDVDLFSDVNILEAGTYIYSGTVFGKKDGGGTAVLEVRDQSTGPIPTPTVNPGGTPLEEAVAPDATHTGTQGLTVSGDGVYAQINFLFEIVLHQSFVDTVRIQIRELLADNSGPNSSDFQVRSALIQRFKVG